MNENDLCKWIIKQSEKYRNKCKMSSVCFCPTLGADCWLIGLGNMMIYSIRICRFVAFRHTGHCGQCCKYNEQDYLMVILSFDFCISVIKYIYLSGMYDFYFTLFFFTLSSNILILWNFINCDGRFSPYWPLLLDDIRYCLCKDPSYCILLVVVPKMC